MSSAELTITLPPDMAERIKHKVQSGAYTSASEVIRDGLQALDDREVAMERWIRDDVLPGHAEYLADPTTAIAADNLLERLKSRHGTRGG